MCFVCTEERPTSLGHGWPYTLLLRKMSSASHGQELCSPNIELLRNSADVTQQNPQLSMETQKSLRKVLFHLNLENISESVMREIRGSILYMGSQDPQRRLQELVWEVTADVVGCGLRE